MGLIQTIIWKWRIERGIAEVQRVAVQHPEDIAYRITTAQSALSIFLELPSLEKSLLKTSDAEGEELQDLFLKRWKAKYPWCVDGTIPAIDSR